MSNLQGYGFQPIIGVAGVVYLSSDPEFTTGIKDSPAVPGSAGATTDRPLGGVFRDLEVEKTDEQHIPLRNSGNGGKIEGFMQGDSVRRIRFTFEPRASRSAATPGVDGTTIAESKLWVLNPRDTIWLEAISGSGHDLSSLLGSDATTARTTPQVGFHVLSVRETSGENSARTFQVEAVQYEGTAFAKISA